MQRRLTAIMFTDIQGYTAMMREDEATTLTLRNRHREIFETLTKKYRGKLVQYFGDGTLTTFDSTVNAVECALELQKAFLQKPVIPVRIGIHVGDIVFYENDIVGDAVNVASRIESIAKSGAVFFSGHVNDQLRSHKKLKTKYLDVFHFKNVNVPVPVFALVDDAIEVPDSAEIEGSQKVVGTPKNSPNGKLKGKKRSKAIGTLFFVLAMAATLFVVSKNFNGPSGENSEPNASSIAILPVQNLSGLDGNDMFCQSITNELVQQLTQDSQAGKVVPNSLLNDHLDEGNSIKDLASSLGVRYILELALHQSDSLYNLDTRLADAKGQKYLWSKRYLHLSESNYLDQIKSVIGQDIVQQVNKDVQSTGPAYSELITDYKDAYELLLRADALADKMDKESFYQAIPLYEKAVQLDPNLAEGYRGLGRIYLMGGMIWGIFNQDEAKEKSRLYLHRSMDLKPTLEASQYLLISKFFFEQDFDHVDEHLSLVSILPSFPDGAFYTVYCNIMGRFDESIRYAEKYVKRFPDAGNGLAQMIRAYFLSGQIKKADSLMNRYDSKFMNDQFYLRDVAMVHLNRGNMDDFLKMNQVLKANFLDNAAVHLYYNAVELTYKDGEKDKIEALLQELESQYDAGRSGSPAWFLAMYHLYIGEEEVAFEWLQKSYERKEVEMVWFKTEHRLQPYRKAKDPRYQAIFNQMNWQ